MSAYRSFRAPRDDQSRLCVPELDQVAASIDENRKRFEAAACQWMDVPLTTVRQWARAELLDQAEAYTRGYLPEGSNLKSGQPSNSPLILSGHQPELFHPGVWFKNFLLSSLSKQHSGVGIHILVDHDLARTFAMSVPTIGQDRLLHKETFSIDDDRPVRPWEHAKVEDLNRWKEFSSAVVDRLRLVSPAKPLLCELWPNVIAALEQGRPLGEAFSAARHIVERSNGLQTLELPFSRLTSERSFACFVGELLTRFESVHETYNTVRHAYRLHHRIKNRLQPLPALARDGDWFESPFWVYSAADPVRRALWVLRDESRLRISDRQQWQVELPGKGSFEEWYSSFRELKSATVSIRPRALTTTMFLRLAVADLFIHGIGGGKYDQMTDQILSKLWAISAPNYLVATATLQLPMEVPESGGTPSIELSEAEVLRRIRDWRFSPERLLVDDIASKGELRSWVDKKGKLLAMTPRRQEKPAWHREIQQINLHIRQCLDESEASLGDLLREARDREREQVIRRSREYSLALFPSTLIVDRLKKLCHTGFGSDRRIQP